VTRGPAGAVSTDDTTTPFSIENHAELDRVTAGRQSLAARAESVRASLPAADRAAFHQLVLHPVKATANLYALRQAQFLNRRYWTQGRAATNDLAAAPADRLTTRRDVTRTSDLPAPRTPESGRFRGTTSENPVRRHWRTPRGVG